MQAPAADFLPIPHLSLLSLCCSCSPSRTSHRHTTRLTILEQEERTAAATKERVSIRRGEQGEKEEKRAEEHRESEGQYSATGDWHAFSTRRCIRVGWGKRKREKKRADERRGTDVCTSRHSFWHIPLQYFPEEKEEEENTALAQVFHQSNHKAEHEVLDCEVGRSRGPEQKEQWFFAMHDAAAV